LPISGTAQGTCYACYELVGQNTRGHQWRRTATLSDLTPFAHTRPLIQRTGRWVRLGLESNTKAGDQNGGSASAFARRSTLSTHARSSRPLSGLARGRYCRGESPTRQPFPNLIRPRARGCAAARPAKAGPFPHEGRLSLMRGGQVGRNRDHCASASAHIAP
jgi:hypothetical protein